LRKQEWWIEKDVEHKVSSQNQFSTGKIKGLCSYEVAFEV
tara:strand:+ start:401 stop:520 length:120 start_codon:yes stop_codon:yes gene_type:complete